MVTSLLTLFAATCDPNKMFFGLPVWYKYLMNSSPQKFSTACEFTDAFSFPQDLGLIVLVGADIVLRLAALIAVGYVVYGGVQFITAGGEPDKTKKARETIINALIGLGIALVAVGVVNFIGNSIT
jgi:hypothetical protein